MTESQSADAGQPDQVAAAAGSVEDLAAATLARTVGSSRSRTTAASPRRRPRASSAGPDSRDPQLVGEGINRLLAERGWEHTASGAALVGRWADIVGPEVAAHVVCETFTPGTAPDGSGDGPGQLVLRADSTAWATQMRMLLPTVRTRIEEVVGPGVVGRISILGPNAPTRSPGRLRVPGRGPRDTYG